MMGIYKLQLNIGKSLVGIYEKMMGRERRLNFGMTGQLL